MRKASPDKKQPKARDNNENAKLPNKVEIVARRVLVEELSNFETRFEAKIDVKILDRRKEYERYMGALVEDFQSKLDAITEVVVATAEDMTSIKDWIKEDHYNTHLIINSRLNVLEAGATS
jgi:hypothetical protein